MDGVYDGAVPGAVRGEWGNMGSGSFGVVRAVQRAMWFVGERRIDDLGPVVPVRHGRGCVVRLGLRCGHRAGDHFVVGGGDRAGNQDVSDSREPKGRRVMKRFSKVAGVIAGVGAGMAVAGSAAAQFAATTAQNTSSLLGDDTSNTGIYEIESIVPIGLGVAIAIVVAFVGFYMVRKLIMKVRG